MTDPEPRRSADILAKRRFADLSPVEQETYRQLREKEADETMRRICANLNRNVR